MTVEPAQLDSLSKARTCVPALLQPNGDLVRIYLVINSLYDYGVVYNPFFARHRRNLAVKRAPAVTCQT